MISTELRRRVEVLEIHARKLVDSVFSGEYGTVFRGQGLEFRDLKEYLPGDDVRFIDNRILAKTGKPYVRTYKEEREITLLFLVDLSASTLFGKKREALQDLTALLSLSAVKNGDKFALGGFTDHLELYVPPGQGEKHLWRILENLVNLQPKSQTTDIQKSLSEISRQFKRRCVVFLISDFFDETWEVPIRSWGFRHDLTLVRVVDPLEKGSFPKGLIPVKDLETGQMLWVDGPGISAEKNENLSKKIQGAAHSSGAGFLEITAGEDWFPKLVDYFWRRQRFGRR